jgi:hypothetical protein
MCWRVTSARWGHFKYWEFGSESSFGGVITSSTYASRFFITKPPPTFSYTKRCETSPAGVYSCPPKRLKTSTNCS